jgi:hypothetical protein
MNKYAGWMGLALLMPAVLFGADNVLTPQEKAAGWVLLFDGKTLNGWDPVFVQGAGRGRGQGAGAAPKVAKAAPQPGAAPAQGSNPLPCSTAGEQAAIGAGASHWEVVGGELSPCGDIAGYLSSKANYKDLTLTIDFKTAEDTNSGVFVRGPAGGLGYEVQIWKAQPAGFNTGSIVGAGKTDREYKFIPDQWNHYEITAEGDHLTVILNGTKTLDIHDPQFSDGAIRLQYQKFPIRFKNIKVLAIQH